jgi:N-acetylgalactosamine kinase
LGKPVALDVIVDGTVPQGLIQCFSCTNLSFCSNDTIPQGLLLLFLLLGSGLSSSAAFVCSATIAIMGILEKNFPKVLLNASN